MQFLVPNCFSCRDILLADLYIVLYTKNIVVGLSRAHYIFLFIYYVRLCFVELSGENCIVPTYTYTYIPIYKDLAATVRLEVITVMSMNYIRLDQSTKLSSRYCSADFCVGEMV